MKNSDIGKTEEMSVLVHGKPHTVDVPIKWVRPEEWRLRSDLMTKWLNEHPGVDIIPAEEVEEIYREARRIYFFEHQTPDETTIFDPSKAGKTTAPSITPSITPSTTTDLSNDNTSKPNS